MYCVECQVTSRAQDADFENKAPMPELCERELLIFSDCKLPIKNTIFPVHYLKIYHIFIKKIFFELMNAKVHSLNF